ncbi:Bug family tripartite tricarboxylate transporter substrate binding protein [Elioraea rosea]|uniref:Bug family tripartite tricarboxylate transporter substrate binding protein n=1 Tax=Elioraea rosea TaxID=2492390 RepID=UPI00118205C5|nr:tripartite tricarboxylate transporter substrate-binding protein [Elioraea rosea]
MIRIAASALALAIAVAPGQATAQFQPSNPECIAGAAPGGGFDLTCRLTGRMLNELGIVQAPMRTTNMPGGIGAVAMNHIQAQRRADPNTVVAVSTGSFLNLATGKFGRWTENDVRWIGAIGADFGVIVVRKDSPLRSLADLVAALKANPASVPMGAGGTVGSQDWMKAALIARAAGVNPRAMRYVPYEGGGQSMAALLGGHIQVFPGDASEVKGQLEAGEIRVLATLSPNRLPAPFADVPTAKEQGLDVEWAIIRGLYMAPAAPDEAYTFWVDALRKLTSNPAWPAARDGQGLFPFDSFGEEFSTLVKSRVQVMRDLSKEMGLIQ